MEFWQDLIDLYLAKTTIFREDLAKYNLWTLLLDAILKSSF